MSLTRFAHRVGGVAFGGRTTFSHGLLTVSAEAATAVVASPALAKVRLSWASPGESVRIVKVLDSVEPRSKGPGGGGIFPGFVGHGSVVGVGETHVLVGAAVVSAGYLPRAQEAVIDMSGPAARLSPLGSTHNLVVEFTRAEDHSWEEVDRALRRGTLALAAYLADAALEEPPDEVEELESPTARRGSLPRVGVITNLQTQGSFKDVFVYGTSFAGSLPALVDPGDFEDGAVVSGQFGHPALKNPTFVHQNNPVVAELRRRHGHDLDFAGVVICPEPVEQTRKAMISVLAARACAMAGFDAAVVTKEGGGNADGDIALKLDALSELGIEPVGIFAEMSGTDGTGPPIVVAPERPAGLVSTGNYDHVLVLPAVERALGGLELAVAGVGATDSVEVPAAVMYCSLSPLGWGHLAGRPQA